MLILICLSMNPIIFLYMALQRIIPLIQMIKSSLFRVYFMKPECSAIKEKCFVSYLLYLLFNKKPK